MNIAALAVEYNEIGNLVREPEGGLKNKNQRQRQNFRSQLNSNWYRQGDNFLRDADPFKRAKGSGDF